MDARSGQKKQKLKSAIRCNWIISCDTEGWVEIPFPPAFRKSNGCIRIAAKTAIEICPKPESSRHQTRAEVRVTVLAVRFCFFALSSFAAGGGPVFVLEGRRHLDRSHPVLSRGEVERSLYSARCRCPCRCPCCCPCRCYCCRCRCCCCPCCWCCCRRCCCCPCFWVRQGFSLGPLNTRHKIGASAPGVCLHRGHSTPQCLIELPTAIVESYPSVSAKLPQSA